MLEVLKGFFKRIGKKEEDASNSKEAAKERLHLVLMQDRANVSADFLDLMKQEIIEVIKKYIEVDEKEIDVRLTNQIKDDGTNGAPALYANIPILGIKSEKKIETQQKQQDKSNKTNVSEISGKTKLQSNKENEEKNEKEDNNKVDYKQENDNSTEQEKITNSEDQLQVIAEKEKKEQIDVNKNELNKDTKTSKAVEIKKTETMKKNNKKMNKSNTKKGSYEISLKNVYKPKK